MSTLNDDLLHEFREERTLINEQISLLDPLATQLRKPAAQRIVSAGILVFLEILCYLISLAGIAFMVFLNKIYPFNILSDLMYNTEYRDNIGLANVSYLNIAVYCLAGVTVLLFYIIARITRKVRLKNAVLNMAGRDIKTIVGQHLKRKAAINTIVQRHFMELPGIQNVYDVNEVPNPGYDDNVAAKT